MKYEPASEGYAAGCLAASGSALLTGLLLFLNGGVVLALLNALASGGMTFVRDERFSQFVVLFVPVVMVVFEWIMIDYLRARLIPSRRNQIESPESNKTSTSGRKQFDAGRLGRE